ncbi:TPA: hypothetical protein M4162_004087 [Klebsiella variicola]|nr:hypothetical protein [Klebsiella variicola]HDK6397553.1 hypothetical protein [Klebsiella variicola]
MLLRKSGVIDVGGDFMNYKILSFALLFTLPFMASGTSLIVCDPQDKNGNTDSGIWPVPYLLNNKLCFDMRIDSGDTCAGNGRTANWFSRGVIVSVDNESQGRDDTLFRVIKPVINDKEIEYIVEASRDGESWYQISHVSIDRLSGHAIDWFINEHGGASYQCHLEGPRI